MKIIYLYLIFSKFLGSSTNIYTPIVILNLLRLKSKHAIFAPTTCRCAESVTRPIRTDFHIVPAAKRPPAGTGSARRSANSATKFTASVVRPPLTLIAYVMIVVFRKLCATHVPRGFPDYYDSGGHHRHATNDSHSDYEP